MKRFYERVFIQVRNSTRAEKTEVAHDEFQSCVIDLDDNFCGVNVRLRLAEIMLKQAYRFCRAMGLK